MHYEHHLVDSSNNLTVGRQKSEHQSYGDCLEIRRKK